MISQEIPIEPLLKEWKQTEFRLLKVISTYSDENFHSVPFEGSWTAAQVCDHVAKSLAGVVISFSQQNEPPQRMPDQYVEMLKSLFLNFDQKFQSPSAILPGKSPAGKNEMYKKLKHIGDQLSNAIQKEDLSQLCTLYPFPTIGNLTRVEWITFSCFHTQRHIFQLEKISRHLNP